MLGFLCCAIGCWHQSWKKIRHRRSRATQNSRKQQKLNTKPMNSTLNSTPGGLKQSSRPLGAICGVDIKRRNQIDPNPRELPRWSSPLPSFMWPHGRFTEPKIKCPHQNKLRRHASPAGKTLTRRGPSLFLSFRALRVLQTASTEASIPNSPSISHRVIVFLFQLTQNPAQIDQELKSCWV